MFLNFKLQNFQSSLVVDWKKKYVMFKKGHEALLDLFCFSAFLKAFMSEVETNHLRQTAHVQDIFLYS